MVRVIQMVSTIRTVVPITRRTDLTVQTNVLYVDSPTLQSYPPQLYLHQLVPVLQPQLLNLRQQPHSNPLGLHRQPPSLTRPNRRRNRWLARSTISQPSQQ